MYVNLILECKYWQDQWQFPWLVHHVSCYTFITFSSFKYTIISLQPDLCTLSYPNDGLKTKIYKILPFNVMTQLSLKYFRTGIKNDIDLWVIGCLFLNNTLWIQNISGLFYLHIANIWPKFIESSEIWNWQNIDMNKQTRTYLETLLRSTGQLKDVYHAGLSYISMFTAYIRSEFL